MREFKTLYASDPNKFKSGVYTSKPMKGENIDFKQTLFIEKSAFDSLLKDAQELVEALEFYAQGAPVIGYDRGERAVEAIQSFNEKWGSHE